jgi:hypothetical protein
MSENPVDVIEAAICSAFTSYPKEDDPDWRSPHWTRPGECAHLAQGILLELQAKGFEIVKRKARSTEEDDRRRCSNTSPPLIQKSRLCWPTRKSRSDRHTLCRCLDVKFLQ